MVLNKQKKNADRNISSNPSCVETKQQQCIFLYEKFEMIIYSVLQIHIFPRHALPNFDQIYAISEVIILNNDQNQHKKKQYQQTTRLIQRLISISHLQSIGVIVAVNFCLRKCVYCLQVCLAWKTIFCQTNKVNRVKHVQIQQGTCQEDANTLDSFKKHNSAFC